MYVPGEICVHPQGALTDVARRRVMQSMVKKVAGEAATPPTVSACLGIPGQGDAERSEEGRGQGAREPRTGVYINT